MMSSLRCCRHFPESKDLVQGELNRRHKCDCHQLRDDRMDGQLLDEKPETSRAQRAAEHPDRIEARKPGEHPVTHLEVEIVIQQEVVANAHGDADEIGQLVVQMSHWAADQRRVDDEIKRRARASDQAVDDEFTALLKVMPVKTSALKAGECLLEEVVENTKHFTQHIVVMLLILRLPSLRPSLATSTMAQIPVAPTATATSGPLREATVV